MILSSQNNIKTISLRRSRASWREVQAVELSAVAKVLLQNDLFNCRKVGMPKRNAHNKTKQGTAKVCVLMEAATWIFRLKACSHNLISRIRVFLVPKIGSWEHSKNYLPTYGSEVLNMLYFHPILFLKDEKRRRKRNLEIGLSERQLTILGTKNRIFETRWCEHSKNDLPKYGSVILRKMDGNRTCSVFI